MSLSTKNTTPITADGLLNEIKLKHLDPSTLVGLGVNKDGTLVRIAEFPKKKLNKLLPPVEHFYTITDVPTATGGFSFSNKTISTILDLSRANGASGTFGPGGTAAQIWILKYCVIQTTGIAGARQLTLDGTHPVSSKTVAASSVGDLLDREIPCFGNDTFTILHEDASDVFSVGFVRVL